MIKTEALFKTKLFQFFETGMEIFKQYPDADRDKLSRDMATIFAACIVAEVVGNRLDELTEIIKGEMK